MLIELCLCCLYVGAYDGVGWHIVNRHLDFLNISLDCKTYKLNIKIAVENTPNKGLNFLFSRLMKLILLVCKEEEGQWLAWRESSKYRNRYRFNL